MDRRLFLQGVAGTALAAAMPAAALAQPAGEDARLRKLLDAFWDELIAENPEDATALGLDVGANAGLRHQLSDYSSAGRDAMFARDKARLARLTAIDPAKLSDAAKIDYEVVAYQLDRQVKGGERFRFGEGPSSSFSYAPYSPYIVSQLSGPYQALPDFLDTKHPVANAADADAYLTRLKLAAKAIDDSTAALKADAAKGVLAPDFLLEQASVQLAKLAASDGLVTSFGRKAASAGLPATWQERAAAILAADFRPAVERQKAAVDALRGTATADAGIWKIPDGEAFYAGALAYQTTTALKPDEVHALGLEQVKALTDRIDGLLRAEGLTSGSVTERLVALNTRPDQLFPNTDAGREQVLAYLRGRVADIEARLPRAFATIPNAPIEIVRVPAAIEDGAANGYAQPASLDGKRPGRFYINLKDTGEWPRYALPSLAFHEAYPGHLWQVAVSQQSKDIPMIRRMGGFSAYGEGWGLYAEQLGDELGCYDADPLGRVGYLQSILFRAVRLVVDSGLHAKRWSREKATNYMVEATGRPRGGMQREIDRYCIWPGQACSYKVGHNEFVRLREEARRRQGERFDIRQFHEVLKAGSLPLVVLERVLKTTLV
ncbi:DUF885 domain-containing protein [Phenylobacterium kunshanense]|uniref:DUF885 domain-containing protein n=1 Tax=Phenylobacterium kunshanense TaxID=1445034 RepID=A0A328BEC3_9CAUL|nr:DUF885 family protein [Phenylobacterium kunshanense]RAK65005.1 DUF885 domain-containing protein [Phenylobacterium kunshanense]